MSILKYILDNEHFIAAQLLSTDRFISYCKDRGIRTSREHLERLEKLGLFYPVARVRYPLLKIKVRYSQDRLQCQDLGVLERGEKWDGELREQYAHFEFEKDLVKAWWRSGRVWDPAALPFKEWETFFDKKRYHRKVEGFYSIFQCYPLHQLIKLASSFNVSGELWATYDDEQAIRVLSKIRDHYSSVISSIQKHGVRGQEAAAICQVIANRYYWHTQTDRRTLHTSVLYSYHDWDWDEYRRTWNAKAVLSELGLTTEYIKRLFEQATISAKSTDPLERWRELVRFISVDKKQGLKGDALLAQDLYAIAHMLQLFYEDVTGECARSPDEWPDWTWDRVYGEGVTQDELLYLELLTNEYHLNPRPKLVLVVEGDGEEEQFPRLAEQLFGYKFTKLGIQIINLKGVANFSGDKRDDKYGALKRFIDNYHDRQTIVFVVLDKEGRAQVIKNRLTRVRSEFYPKRTVTKEEYVRLWDKSIEFDNFSHEEIARAMTEASQHRYEFRPEEIADCERRFGREGNTLSRLFSEKIGDRQLNKRELLRNLCNHIIENAENEFSEDGQPIRPVVVTVRRVIELAAMNYQPVTRKVWQENQESGYFGEIIDEE